MILRKIKTLALKFIFTITLSDRIIVTNFLVLIVASFIRSFSEYMLASASINWPNSPLESRAILTSRVYEYVSSYELFFKFTLFKRKCRKWLEGAFLVNYLRERKARLDIFEIQGHDWIFYCRRSRLLLFESHIYLGFHLTCSFNIRVYSVKR